MHCGCCSFAVLKGADDLVDRNNPRFKASAKNCPEFIGLNKELGGTSIAPKLEFNSDANPIQLIEARRRGIYTCMYIFLIGCRVPYIMLVSYPLE